MCGWPWTRWIRVRRWNYNSTATGGRLGDWCGFWCWCRWRRRVDRSWIGRFYGLVMSRFGRQDVRHLLLRQVALVLGSLCNIILAHWPCAMGHFWWAYLLNGWAWRWRVVALAVWLNYFTIWASFLARRQSDGNRGRDIDFDDAPLLCTDVTAIRAQC